MILQITETLAPVIESAKHETSGFTLLFMLLVLGAVCWAFVKFYNDNKKERKEFKDERDQTTSIFMTMIEKLNINIHELSKNVAANTAEAKENRAFIERILEKRRDG
jgi:uncharacterized protein HemX